MKDVTRWNKEYTNNKDLRDYLDYIKKFKVLSKEEQITLLSSNGMLVKRPLLFINDKLIIGFDRKAYDLL